MVVECKTKRGKGGRLLNARPTNTPLQEDPAPAKKTGKKRKARAKSSKKKQTPKSPAKSPAKPKPSPKKRK